ncbi:MAG: ferredoxin hydrogenase [Sarcina sp.]
MAKVKINNKEVVFEGEETILKLAIKNDIDIPSLCFLEDCGNRGRCGVCLIEIEGKEGLQRACITNAEDGMVVTSESEKVKEEVKKTISNLLDTHDFKCGSCKRKVNCELLKLIIKTKAKANKPFIVEDKTLFMDERSKSLVIDRSRCVKCGRCVSTCRVKTTTESILFHSQKDGNIIVGPKELKCFDDTSCLLCGQCLISCPVDALQEKSHLERVETALNNPDKHVVISAMAPSVRTGIGELFGMGYGVDVTKKIYTALRKCGFRKVFDINFAADVTIMEEGTELIERIKTGGPFPMFTSCCPGWIRLVEYYYPELLNNISSSKSPQQIFGAASKTYYPYLEKIDPKDVFTVTVMPCIAKKYESERAEMENDDIRNIDAVLTARELVQLIKRRKIDFENLEDSEVDPAMGEYTGAGVLFGATGGVMEAALRTTADILEKRDLKDIEYTEVRGLQGIKEATVEINGEKIKVAVINGASNLFEFMEAGKINEGYHFIEVMACSGGCVNGGGQPHVNAKDRSRIDIRKIRASILYDQDANKTPKRKAHENEAVLKMYENFIGKPGEGKAHELFHTTYKQRGNYDKTKEN